MDFIRDAGSDIAHLSSKAAPHCYRNATKPSVEVCALSSNPVDSSKLVETSSCPMLTDCSKNTCESIINGHIAVVHCKSKVASIPAEGQRGDGRVQSRQHAYTAQAVQVPDADAGIIASSCKIPAATSHICHELHAEVSACQFCGSQARLTSAICTQNRHLSHAKRGNLLHIGVSLTAS